MESAKDLLKEIGDIFEPEKDKPKIASLFELLGNMPQTPMSGSGIRPTAAAPEQIPPTTENIGASMSDENLPLAKKYPFKKGGNGRIA